MKISSVVSFFMLLLTARVIATEVSSSPSGETKTLKAAEKISYPKKVNSLKKNSFKISLKKIADITEKFKDLPADDLEFIKELDKQFKLHGGKIKIKVENNNLTETKNSKRTIDRELGYGYGHNGYEYNTPKFMFYPYSQHNIDNKATNQFLTGDEKTEVTIEPSYSYELRPQTYITQNEPQIDVPKTEQHQPEQHQLQYHQHYDEPVIVLRIPGPAKYATHLQMLLQKYLEIRAAQYLRILEEAEKRNNQLQHVNYGEVNSEVHDAHIVHTQQPKQQVTVADQLNYNQEIQYDHQISVTPPPIQYPDIDNVYQNYKHIHSSQQEQFQQPQQDQQSFLAQSQSNLDEYQPQYKHKEEHQLQYDQHVQQYQPQDQQQLQHQQEEQPQFYYAHHQQYAQPEGPPANIYQQVYLLSTSPEGRSDYNRPQNLIEKHQPIYVQEQVNQNEQTQSITLTENNPRPSHTKVVFTKNKDNINQEYLMYKLPSIKPNERHPPTSIPNYHQDFQQGHDHLQRNGGVHYNSAEPASQKVVDITQRPFNYHAHNVKMRARGRTAHKSHVISTTDADHGLQKIREYVREKLGAETGSAVEFKITEFLDG